MAAHGKKKLYLTQTNVYWGGREEWTTASSGSCPQPEAGDRPQRSGAQQGAARQGRAQGWARAEHPGPGPGTAVATWVSGNEGPSQRHGARAGGHLAIPQRAQGPARWPLLQRAQVNCREGFVSPCPDVQCICCYFCIFPPLKLHLTLQEQSLTGNLGLSSCEP